MLPSSHIYFVDLKVQNLWKWNGNENWVDLSKIEFRDLNIAVNFESSEYYIGQGAAGLEFYGYLAKLV